MAQQSQRPTRQEKREAARAEAQRIREQQARRDKRNRTITIGAVVGVLALAIIAVIVIIQQGNKPAADSVSAKPAGITADGGYPIGSGLVAGTTNENAKVTVEIYSDYMCPYCGIYERTLGSTLEDMTNNGTIAYVIHPIAFLDYLSSGTNYSTRATNAAAIIDNLAPDKLLKFHELLFANQPEENSEGLTDEQIAQYATDAGVPADVVSQLTSGTFADWVKAATNDALKVTDSTPYVLINGKEWKPTNVQDADAMVQEFTKAVEDAGGVPTVSEPPTPSDGATATDSPTPSPTLSNAK